MTGGRIRKKSDVSEKKNVSSTKKSLTSGFSPETSTKNLNALQNWHKLCADLPYDQISHFANNFFLNKFENLYLVNIFFDLWCLGKSWWELFSKSESRVFFKFYILQNISFIRICFFFSAIAKYGKNLMQSFFLICLEKMDSYQHNFLASVLKCKIEFAIEKYFTFFVDKMHHLQVPYEAKCEYSRFFFFSNLNPFLKIYFFE